MHGETRERAGWLGREDRESKLARGVFVLEGRTMAFNPKMGYIPERGNHWEHLGPAMYAR
jgi:hypothetical protein